MEHEYSLYRHIPVSIGVRSLGWRTRWARSSRAPLTRLSKCIIPPESPTSSRRWPTTAPTLQGSVHVFLCYILKSRKARETHLLPVLFIVGSQEQYPRMRLQRLVNRDLDSEERRRLQSWSVERKTRRVTTVTVENPSIYTTPDWTDQYKQLTVYKYVYKT